MFEKNAFGARIRQVREALALSQDAFAARCQIKQGTLSNVEQGKNVPGVDFLERIWVGVGNIRLEWLLTGEGEMLSDLRKANPPSVDALLQGVGMFEKRGAIRDVHQELEELNAIGRQGSQRGAWRILRALDRAGRPLGWKELLAGSGQDEQELKDEIVYLRRSGLVVEEEGRVRLATAVLHTADHADGAQLVLQGVRVLLTEVLPAADRQDGSGRVATAELFVAAGAGAQAVQMLLEQVMAVTSELPRGPERVVVVLGATTNGGHDA